MLASETQNENPLLEKYIKTIESFTQNDLDEIETLLQKVSSPKLKSLLQRDLHLARSKLCTKLLNEAVERENEKLGYFVKKKTIVVEREIEVIEEDEEGWIQQNIKGYKEKVRSIKTLLPDKKTKEIRDALIRCKGREEDAMEGLLTGELPKRPQIPKVPVKKIIKETKEVTETETLDVSNKDPNKPKPIDYFEDITLPKYENNVDLLSDRVNRLKKMIDIEKNETKRLTKQVETFRSKGSSSGLSDWIGNNADAGGDSVTEMTDEEEAKRNRMYLPGEYETIEKDEPRIFTFKPERTFSNEVSHIHFRVAESEFHRLLNNKTGFKVKEVKYIVTPWIVKQFEHARLNIAFDLGKKYSEVKPILTFCDIGDYSDDNIDWIVKNNIRSDGKKAIVFTNDNKTAGPIIESNKGKIMLFLVLPGRSSSISNPSAMKNASISELKTNHSFRTSDQLHVALFNTELVLPYYIISYDSSTAQQNNYNPQQPYGVVRLDEEWKNIEANAQADKFMNDVKEFYQKTLIASSKERVLDPTTFTRPNDDPSPLTPGSGLSGGDYDYLQDDTPTPGTSTSTKHTFDD